MGDELQIDDGLLQDFLTECDELLQSLDQDLVLLEGSPEDAELLNRVFRAFHTIKGTSGFMGFTQVVELTHHAEDVLNALRKGERKVTPRTMDVLLTVLDHLRRMMGDIRAGERREYELGTLLGSLKQLLQPEEDRPMLGEILVAQKVITHAERQEALAESVHSDRRLGEVLIEKQLVSPSEVKEALAQQSAPAEGKESARTVRVDVTKLDDLVNLVGELVLERNRLQQVSREFQQSGASHEKLDAMLAQCTGRVSFITEELQSACLKARMVPVDMVFRRMPRLVRDISRNLSKEVELVIRGEDTELDKTVVEEIADPLVHLIRNSMDHGIEAAEVRREKGKPAKGRIVLEARQEGDHIVVSVSDDGGGIDQERVARKALEKGLVSAERLRAMSSQEILELIFLPGFSTAEVLSDVSGRGVGMDVVRTNLKKLNGVVELESGLGQGSLVTLKLPLTLAILPVLLVRVARETYALPLRTVLETIRIRPADIHRVDGEEVLHLRDRVLPIRRLGALALASGEAPPADGLLRVVVIGIGERRIGLVVDQLLGQEETVIKPLGSYLKNVPGLAGATIGGDGRVRLILDPAGVAAALAQPQA